MLAGCSKVLHGMVREVTIRVDEDKLPELKAYMQVVNWFRPGVVFEIVNVAEPAA
jgi:hypothetical protein